jgi:hypothetical protein
LIEQLIHGLYYGQSGTEVIADKLPGIEKIVELRLKYRVNDGQDCLRFVSDRNRDV